MTNDDLRVIIRSMLQRAYLDGDTGFNMTYFTDKEREVLHEFAFAEVEASPAPQPSASIAGFIPQMMAWKEDQILGPASSRLDQVLMKAERKVLDLRSIDCRRQAAKRAFEPRAQALFEACRETYNRDFVFDGRPLQLVVSANVRTASLELWFSLVGRGRSMRLDIILEREHPLMGEACVSIGGRCFSAFPKLDRCLDEIDLHLTRWLAELAHEEPPMAK
jgi:hypothetical protein